MDDDGVGGAETGARDRPSSCDWSLASPWGRSESWGWVWEGLEEADADSAIKDEGKKCNEKKKECCNTIKKTELTIYLIYMYKFLYFLI